MPKSSSCCLIHMISAQQLLTATYSILTVDNATECCFLLNHKIKLTLKNWQVPLVLFQSNLHSAKSTSEYPINSKGDILSYYKLTLSVPDKYLKILLTTNKWDSLGSDWYLAYIQILNIISDLLAVR